MLPSAFKIFRLKELLTTMLSLVGENGMVCIILGIPNKGMSISAAFTLFLKVKSSNKENDNIALIHIGLMCQMRIFHTVRTLQTANGKNFWCVLSLDKILQKSEPIFLYFQLVTHFDSSRMYVYRLDGDTGKDGHNGPIMVLHMFA